MKRIIIAIGFFLLVSPLFAFEIPYDGVSGTISTTTATLFSYPCYIDGVSISNGSATDETVIVYDGSTEIYRCVVSTYSNIPNISLKKKISTSLKATATPDNISPKTRIYIGIR